MPELFIDQPEQLVAFAASIKSSPWLALDTEFIREKTYFPRLCLLQISDGNTAACIDPLALTDLTPLLEVLFDTSITKVFHAAGQDLEIFYNEWKQLPQPLFDTQPAAALLGYGEQIGYAGLIQKALNVNLPKDHSRTDWARRPLSKEQLRYALDDVIYLGQAYQKMLQQLESLGRLNWLQNDFAHLSDEKTYIPDPMSMWKKVKGRQHMRGVKLAVLQQLGAWREQQAVRRNLPRRWVLKDEVMLDLARHIPQTPAKMESIRGLEPGMIRRDGDSLLQLLESASKLPRDQWPSDVFAQDHLTPEQEAMSDLLHCALRLLAAENNMSAAAITSKKQLQALVQGERNLALMRGWRKTVAGDLLLDLLDGKRQVIVEKGSPVLTQPA
jgi:ribonuclease D